MAWRFRKRIKLIPGVYLNLSKSGISTTIGTRGLSLNIGSQGAFLNTGIPSTGLFNRIPLGLKSNNKVDNQGTKEIAERLNNILNYTCEDGEQIKSEEIHHLTSAGLTSLKETIVLLINSMQSYQCTSH